MAEYPYVGPVAHSSGNGNLPIHRIVVHCTAGGSDEGSARGTAKYFQMASATGSAHAITDANELVICALDPVVCWHAPPNPHSLGVEIECSLAGDGKGHWSLASHQKKMHLAAKWVAEKCKLHGIPIRKLTVAQLQANPSVEGICGHVDVSLAFHQSTHTDPGPYFPWSQFIGYVQAEYDALTAPPVPPAPVPEDDMPWTEEQLRKMMYGENSRYGANLWAAPTGTGTKLIAVVDGIAGAIDALSKQIASEDLADDTDFRTAMDALNVKLDELKAAIPPPPAPLPKA